MMRRVVGQGDMERRVTALETSMVVEIDGLKSIMTETKRSNEVMESTMRTVSETMIKVSDGLEHLKQNMEKTEQHCEAKQSALVNRVEALEKKGQIDVTTWLRDNFIKIVGGIAVLVFLFEQYM